MRRRDFITLLGGATAWPLAARAQQRTMPVVGFVGVGSPASAAFLATAFQRGLQETGFIESQNVAIDYRWANGRYDMMPDLVADLLRHRVAVLAVTSSAEAALAAKAATAEVPIVFSVADDPVKLGLVASLARPGGNLTGVNFLNSEVTAKRLGLLRELVPGATRVAVLVNPANAGNAQRTWIAVETGAAAMGLRVQVVNVSNGSEINAAFASFARERPDALFVGGDGLFNNRRVQLVNLASRHAIPATYADRILPEVGGLMSYGTDLADAYRQLGVYAGRILNGTKPADLPVVQASKFELVINAETARMLGLTIPDKLLALTDEVIE